MMTAGTVEDLRRIVAELDEMTARLQREAAELRLLLAGVERLAPRAAAGAFRVT